jgi:hypothetical protein
MMNRNTLLMMGVIAGGCMAATGSAWAQGQPQAAQTQPAEDADQRAQVLAEMNKVQERAGEIQRRLNDIAQQVQEQNPDLQKQYAELMDIYQNKLDEYGYPSEEEMQKLQVMQQRLQAPEAGNMDDAERQRLTQEFNTEATKLQEAQEKAQDDPEVVAAQEAFEEARLKAMSEIDPQAPDLLSKLEDIYEELDALRLKLQQVMQAPQP